MTRDALMFTFGVALVAIGIVGAMWSVLSIPRVVHHHGRFDQMLQFCEGGSGELISENGMLIIECADQEDERSRK